MLISSLIKSLDAIVFLVIVQRYREMNTNFPVSREVKNGQF